MVVDISTVYCVKEHRLCDIDYIIIYKNKYSMAIWNQVASGVLFFLIRFTKSLRFDIEPTRPLNIVHAFYVADSGQLQACFYNPHTSSVCDFYSVHARILLPISVSIAPRKFHCRLSHPRIDAVLCSTLDLTQH